MSKNYNSNLQTNNTNLQAILDTINTLPEAGEQAAPVIIVNTNGLITATAGTKSTTKQLTTQSATTITPSTLDQIAINSGVYATGAVTVKGDNNLKAENIVSGKSIFGVNGIAENTVNDTEINIINGTISNYINDKVTFICNYAFCDCNNLVTVNLSNVTTIGSNAFYYCQHLTTVKIAAMNINNNAFENCYRLSSFTLNSVFCTLMNSNAFSNTPFKGYSYAFSGTPVIYVPSSMLTKYQSATNWTYFSKYMIGF